jgi:hypothetical protein
MGVPDQLPRGCFEEIYHVFDFDIFPLCLFKEFREASR